MNFLHKFFFVVLLTLVLRSESITQVGPTQSNVQIQPIPQSNQNRKLIVGDRLSYSVSEDAYAGLQVTPVEIIVQSDGTVNIPVQGPKGTEFPFPPFKATGITPSELQKIVKTALERDFYNTATVSLLLVSFGGSIEVMGEVNSPGTINLPPDRRLTLTGAIASAGGFATYADERRVELRRKKTDGSVEVMRLDVRKIRQTGQGNIEVQHGDEIFVRPISLIPGL